MWYRWALEWLEYSMHSSDTARHGPALSIHKCCLALLVVSSLACDAQYGISRPYLCFSAYSRRLQLISRRVLFSSAAIDERRRWAKSSSSRGGLYSIRFLVERSVTARLVLAVSSRRRVGAPERGEEEE